MRLSRIAPLVLGLCLGSTQLGMTADLNEQLLNQAAKEIAAVEIHPDNSLDRLKVAFLWAEAASLVVEIDSFQAENYLDEAEKLVAGYKSKDAAIALAWFELFEQAILHKKYDAEKVDALGALVKADPQGEVILNYVIQHGGHIDPELTAQVLAKACTPQQLDRFKTGFMSLLAKVDPAACWQKLAENPADGDFRSKRSRVVFSLGGSVTSAKTQGIEPVPPAVAKLLLEFFPLFLGEVKKQKFTGEFSYWSVSQHAYAWHLLNPPAAAGIISDMKKAYPAIAANPEDPWEKQFQAKYGQVHDGIVLAALLDATGDADAESILKTALAQLDSLEELMKIQPEAKKGALFERLGISADGLLQGAPGLSMKIALAALAEIEKHAGVPAPRNIWLEMAVASVQEPRGAIKYALKLPKPEQRAEAYFQISRCVSKQKK